MSRPSWHERLYRGLLRIFPAEFRGDFGDEMADDFRQQRLDAAAGGRRRVARLWTRTALDIGGRAPREHLDLLRRDAGYAVRLLLRRPGFAVITLATLALGIGLNTAVFSVVSAILLRPLPIAESARLVRLFELTPPPEREAGEVSSTNFLDWQAQTRTLDAVTLIGARQLKLTGAGDAELIQAMTVSPEFVRVMSARPALGRLFTPADYAPLAAQFQQPAQQRKRVEPNVVILGHDLWQRRFGGRPDIVGSTVRLDGRNVEVVGVMQQDFAFTEIPGWGHADCWLPEAPNPQQRRARMFTVVGRLAAGHSLAQAQAEFDVIASQLALKYPRANTDRGIRLSPLLQAQTAAVRAELWLLLGAAACVLLIACANVANLLLAHASGRRLELATRLALGATRAHLVRQTLTESLLISVAGGAAGFALAAWALPALVALAPAATPRLNEISVDWRMLAFAAVASIVVGLACGVAVVLSMNRVNPQGGGLRPSGADSAHHGRRFRQGLIVAEIALALMLVVAAGLLVRTLRVLGAQELGFNPRNVISVGLALDFAKYDPRNGAIGQFEADLLERLASAPGVVAAGIGSRPLGGGGASNLVRARGSNQDHRVGVDVVSPGFLEALGATLIRGRFVQATDAAGAPRVALVNVSAAQTIWGDSDPVGQTIVMDESPLQVIGVVGDIRRLNLELPAAPAIYLSHLQPATIIVNNLLVRTAGDPRTVLPAVRAAMRQLDPDQPLARIATLEERIDEILAPRRFMLRLIGLFSVLALGLAMLGVYGVMAESVAQRVPEIGIRVALGATPAAIRHLVIAQGGWMVVLGLAGGIAGALALRRAMSTLVFGVPTTDPLAYAVACVCLAGATLAACAIPANRAATMDPVRALRQD
jgi:putative ABC transport system permease protein